MSTSHTEDWSLVLSKLNSLMFGSDRWKAHMSPEILAAHWCGRPPASEELLLTAERRLGAHLPPSYRSFLSVANGWYPFGSFIEQLLPVSEVDWLRNADPDALAGIQECYQEDEISDQEYLDYETDKHRVALRHRYYPDCLLVGTSWGGGGELVLLNSRIVFPNGEWEALVFANWLPGNHRYRSFRELAEEHVRTQEILDKK